MKHRAVDVLPSYVFDIEILIELLVCLYVYVLLDVICYTQMCCVFNFWPGRCYKETLSWIFENDCSYGVEYSSKGMKTSCKDLYLKVHRI